MSVVAPDWMTDSPGGGLMMPLLVVWMLTAAMAVTVLAFAATAVLPAGGWRSLVPAHPAYVGVGVILVLVPPALIDSGYLTALAFLSPWSFAVCAAGWLRGRYLITAMVGVGFSMLLFAGFSFGPEIALYLNPPPAD